MKVFLSQQQEWKDDKQMIMKVRIIDDNDMSLI